MNILKHNQSLNCCDFRYNWSIHMKYWLAFLAITGQSLRMISSIQS